MIVYFCLVKILCKDLVCFYDLFLVLDFDVNIVFLIEMNN